MCFCGGSYYKKKVDLLFLDVQEVPVKPNSAFMDLIENNKDVVFMSVYPQKMLKMKFDPLGFLDKPISFDAFLETIESFLEKRNHDH